MSLRPSKIVCVGRNYVAHARELGNEMPERPLLFMKPPSALIGPGEAIMLPPESTQVEHEGEIALVIGERVRRIAPDDVRSVLAGVACLNDVTARDLQRSESQFTRSKGFDTFCPLGPAVPVDDLTVLEVICRVNGETRQHGHARDMAFGCEYLVSYISQVMTLEPGDVIATGSPAGVGPLAPGDVVSVEIPGVGIIENPVVAEPAAGTGG